MPKHCFCLQNEITKASPDILKLSLLNEVTTGLEPQNVLNFDQSSLQEFACSKYLAELLDKIMAEGGQKIAVNIYFCDIWPSEPHD